MGEQEALYSNKLRIFVVMLLENHYDLFPKPL
jgi:hypothetical protein